MYLISSREYTKNMNTAVVVEDLRVDYGAVHAVRGVSFTVAVGEIFALVGPNGAGKTTTVEVLEGYRRPTAAADRSSRTVRPVRGR